MPEIAQDLITFGVEIFIFGLILNFRSLQVCRKDAAGRIFPLRQQKAPKSLGAGHLKAVIVRQPYPRKPVSILPAVVRQRAG